MTKQEFDYYWYLHRKLEAFVLKQAVCDYKKGKRTIVRLPAKDLNWTSQ